MYNETFSLGNGSVRRNVESERTFIRTKISIVVQKSDPITGRLRCWKQFCPISYLNDCRYSCRIGYSRNFDTLVSAVAIGAFAAHITSTAAGTVATSVDSVAKLLFFWHFVWSHPLFIEKYYSWGESRCGSFWIWNWMFGKSNDNVKEDDFMEEFSHFNRLKQSSLCTPGNSLNLPN